MENRGTPSCLLFSLGQHSALGSGTVHDHTKPGGTVHNILQEELHRHSRIHINIGKTQVWNAPGIRPPACDELVFPGCQHQNKGYFECCRFRLKRGCIFRIALVWCQRPRYAAKVTESSWITSLHKWIGLREEKGVKKAEAKKAIPAKALPSPTQC